MARSSPARPLEEAPPRKELRGVVERLTYQNPENGYTVARLAPERPRDEAAAAREAADDRLVTVVGTLADLTPGEAIVAHGWWRNDAKYGWQFVAVDYRTTLPATVQGMKKYLGSGLVKGVGPVMAGRIVDAFGEATFDVVDAAPGRLTEVPGIGPVRAQRLAATWEEQRHIREVMAALQGVGYENSVTRRTGSTRAAGRRAGRDGAPDPSARRAAPAGAAGVTRAPGAAGPRCSGLRTRPGHARGAEVPGSATSPGTRGAPCPPSARRTRSLVGPAPARGPRGHPGR